MKKCTLISKFCIIDFQEQNAKLNLCQHLSMNSLYYQNVLSKRVRTPPKGKQNLA